MKTLKELANIGRIAALKEQLKTDGTYTVDMHEDSARDEPARQAFAQAVKEAVEKPLHARISELERWHLNQDRLEKQSVTKPDSPPTFETQMNPPTHPTPSPSRP